MNDAAPQKEQFDVMLILSGEYAFIASPFMYSLIKNNAGWANITFHMITEELPAFGRQFLENFALRNGAHVAFYSVDTKIFGGLKTIKRYPAILYSKLIPHLILPENLTKVLYADVDMIVTSSLRELWETDMGNAYIGACYDYHPFANLKEKSADLPEIKKSYVNSGTVLYNLDLMRRDGLTLDIYKEWLNDNMQTLFEEQLMNHTLLGRIYHFMPFDYNYNPGARGLYSEYCSEHGITPKKAIIHYMPFKNDSPIIKPWDACEYFYSGKENDKFSGELYALYKLWWDYALQLDICELTATLEAAKSNRLQRQYDAAAFERDKWRKYSSAFRKMIEGGLAQYGDGNTLSAVLKSKGYASVAFYGDTEITKLLAPLLESAGMKVAYVIENFTSDTQTHKVVGRDARQYPRADVMIVADVAQYGKIADKLKKRGDGIPFISAAELIESAAAGSDASVTEVSACGRKRYADGEQARYNALINSASYKIGRAITYIPRKIRALFRKKK